MSIWDQFAREGRQLVMVCCSSTFNDGVIQRVCALILTRRVRHVILFGSGARSLESHIRNELARENPSFIVEILFGGSAIQMIKDMPTYQEHRVKYWWGQEPRTGDFTLFIA